MKITYSEYPLKKIVLFLLPTILLFLTISCNQEENTPQVQEPQEVVSTPLLKKSGTYKKVNAAEFNELQKSNPGTILDVREVDQAKFGIIEGAVVAPLYSDNFNKIISTLDKNKPVYVYDASGSLVKIAAKTLLENEFDEIYALAGGITAWGMSGYKTVRPKLIKGEF